MAWGILGHLGRLFGRPGRVSTDPGGILEKCCALGFLGVLWGRLGPVFRGPWAILGGYWARGAPLMLGLHLSFFVGSFSNDCLLLSRDLGET